MNYQNIYNQFIQDRQSKQNFISYGEKHHILPRALGGDNSASNIIRLTAEDHIHAHILLSAIHGGNMWFALGMMTMTKSKFTKRHTIPSKLLIKSLALLRGKRSGQNNNKYNHEVFNWINADSLKEETATLYDMWKKYGGARGSWTMASDIKSWDKPTVFGWHLKDRVLNIRSNKGRIFNFINRDGRVFNGTQKEFYVHINSQSATAARVVNHKSVTKCGWRLEGTEDRGFSSPKDGTRSGPEGKIMKLNKDGETIKGDRIALSKMFNVSVGSISTAIYLLRTGKQKTYKGWELESA